MYQTQTTGYNSYGTGMYGNSGQYGNAGLYGPGGGNVQLGYGPGGVRSSQVGLTQNGVGVRRGQSMNRVGQIPGAARRYVDPGSIFGYQHGVKGPGPSGLSYYKGALPREPSFINAFGRRISPHVYPGDWGRNREGFVGGVGPRQTGWSQRMKTNRICAILAVVGLIVMAILAIIGGLMMMGIFGNAQR